MRVIPWIGASRSHLGFVPAVHSLENTTRAAEKHRYLKELFWEAMCNRYDSFIIRTKYTPRVAAAAPSEFLTLRRIHAAGPAWKSI